MRENIAKHAEFETILHIAVVPPCLTHIKGFYMSNILADERTCIQLHLIRAISYIVGVSHEKEK